MTTHPKVTVYSTTWCAFCKTEKQWLDSLGVEYVSKNIEEDSSAREQYNNDVGGTTTGVPVTNINGEIIIGFNRPALQEALRKAELIS